MARSILRKPAPKTISKTSERQIERATKALHRLATVSPNTTIVACRAIVNTSRMIVNGKVGAR